MDEGNAAAFAGERLYRNDTADLAARGRARVVIEDIQPSVSGGRFPIKRIVGDQVDVKADVFSDGHDVVSAAVQWWAPGSENVHEGPMEPLGNDRWRGVFQVDLPGIYHFTVVGWINRFMTWHRDLKKRFVANAVEPVDWLIGVQFVEAAIKRAPDIDAVQLEQWLQRLQSPEEGRHAEQICRDTAFRELMVSNTRRQFATVSQPLLRVDVERRRAQFSAWYEMFPRSASPNAGQHGTLKDVEERLSYVASMGFNVLYLPPIHPIGNTFRKGPNNDPKAGATDVGSPWAIGSEEGGHKSIHPALGTFEDFEHLVKAAERFRVDLALDIAFQCSPDHPYVREHPEWFRQRPDGTIQYAENPPKKYQDIYPLDFECDDWWGLWNELKSVFEFWIDRGVKIFRVDNPHTKPLPFWEWCLNELKQDHPEVIYLSEAFTRPRIMYRLAKAGFTQSYTYFTWRNTKEELIRYLREIHSGEVPEFFRPNFWPNTPDILPEYLQFGGRAAFLSRFVLAGTLTSNYGVYGPPFEHLWSSPRESGSEEYLHSEKYQIHHHPLERTDSLRHFMARLNRVRDEHLALQSPRGLEFHSIDNDQLICFSRSVPPDVDALSQKSLSSQSSDTRNQSLLIIVSLDPHHRQSGWIDVPLEILGLEPDQPYQVHDLLSDARYLWNGRRNFVELDPQVAPAHILQIRRRVRSERDFEYYL
jgi:starch synthase (maltosyl-transferring)